MADIHKKSNIAYVYQFMNKYTIKLRANCHLPSTIDCIEKIWRSSDIELFKFHTHQNYVLYQFNNHSTTLHFCIIMNTYFFIYIFLICCLFISGAFLWFNNWKSLCINLWLPLSSACKNSSEISHSYFARKLSIVNQV